MGKRARSTDPGCDPGLRGGHLVGLTGAKRLTESPAGGDYGGKVENLRRRGCAPVFPDF